MHRCCICYKDVETPIVCEKCKKREYCSEQCMKEESPLHNLWCNLSGEKNFDWEIRESPEKGLGMFALRDFEQNEKIFVEKALINVKNDFALFFSAKNSLTKLKESQKNAFFSLVHDEEAKKDENKKIISIIRRNGMGIEEDDEKRTHICIEMARINHDCCSNAFHSHFNTSKENNESTEAQLLISRRKIKKGEEITISYNEGMDNTKRFNQRKSNLVEVYKINGKCTSSCPICEGNSEKENTDFKAKKEKIEKLLNQQEFLDCQIGQKFSAGEVDQAIGMVNLILKTYSKIDEFLPHFVNPMLLIRTYFDAFQINASRSKTNEKALFYLQQASDLSEKVFGKFHKSSQKYKSILENPKVSKVWNIFD